ncbi:hypothetical protein PF008_g29310 [Phytophthora fragariae]|uniref:Uncharacterized protein n=1 Tax=Phytophthora fragariae TaxID=53985 RepID=A0A6G0Q8W7_9STRA|nr:hypothetical protein PF008_g29310 [Phytophthora fragariae]
MSASKVLDFHIIAKHVRERAQKEAAASKNPKTKLLISAKERAIIFDGESASTLSTPPPRLSEREHEESDNDDRGDGVDGDEALSLWSDYLDEVFVDEEIDAGYEATLATPPSAEPSLRGVGESSDEEDNNDANEFESIQKPFRLEFPQINDRAFPQESVRLLGFRGQKVTLADLFG